MKQELLILNHLKSQGSITPLEALNVYGVYRLSSVINRLRNKGHLIATDINKEKKFAKYSLVD